MQKLIITLLLAIVSIYGTEETTPVVSKPVDTSSIPSAGIPDSSSSLEPVSQDESQEISIAALSFFVSNTLENRKEIYSERFRLSLNNVLNIRTLPASKIDSILGEHQLSQYSCRGVPCAVTIGKTLAVDYVIGGSIISKDKSFSVKSKLISVSKNEAIGSYKKSYDTCTFETFADLSIEYLTNSIATTINSIRRATELKKPISETPISMEDSTTTVARTIESDDLDKPDIVSTEPDYQVIAPEKPSKPVPEGMALIQGGSFTMGSSASVGDKDEHPAHTVYLSSFLMDKHEVTQAKFKKVMKKKKNFHNEGCPLCPAENVSWLEANAYCKKVGKRLPTEAEWEYACRAGSSTRYYWGDDIKSEYTWYFANSRNKTHAACHKEPNPFDLYDMTGNVWEWCSDWYNESYYQSSESKNPRGPRKGGVKSIRGGSYKKKDAILRSANRGNARLNRGSPEIGFRCVKDMNY